MFKRPMSMPKNHPNVVARAKVENPDDYDSRRSADVKSLNLVQRKITNQ